MGLSSELGGWEGPGEHLVQTSLSRGQDTESQETLRRCRRHASWAQKPGLWVSGSSPWPLPTGQAARPPQSCPSAAGEGPTTLGKHFGGLANSSGTFPKARPVHERGFQALGRQGARREKRGDAPRYHGPHSDARPQVPCVTEPHSPPARPAAAGGSQHTAWSPATVSPRHAGRPRPGRCCIGDTSARKRPDVTPCLHPHAPPGEAVSKPRRGGPVSRCRRPRTGASPIGHPQ